MNCQERMIREIKDEANRQAMNDPATDFVCDAKIAIRVIESLDPSKEAVIDSTV